MYCSSKYPVVEEDVRNLPGLPFGYALSLNAISKEERHSWLVYNVNTKDSLYLNVKGSEMFELMALLL